MSGAQRHFFLWLLSCVVALSSFGHEADGDISYILVEFPEEGVWQLSARLDAEALFLSFAEGWPTESTYAELAALYWNFENSGSEIRERFLVEAAKHIRVEIDGAPRSLEHPKISLDPAFSYESSQGEAMWGLVEFSGPLPQSADRFQVYFPESYYPLQYEVRMSGPDDSSKEFFRPRSGQLPRPFLFDSGAFAPRSLSEASVTPDSSTTPEALP